MKMMQSNVRIKCYNKYITARIRMIDLKRMLKKQRLLKMSSSQRKDVEKSAKLRWRKPSVWKSKCWGENQRNAQLWIGQSKRLSFLCNNSSVNTPSGHRPLKPFLPSQQGFTCSCCLSRNHYTAYPFCACCDYKVLW
jgi:hypothetical protein